MLYQILSGQMSPTEIVALLIALVLGISVHEFSHAAAATWLGDTLPGRQGRLTLAPAAHLDVVGSLMFLIGGFGWGKPVPVNPYYLRRNSRTEMALVALAGPVSPGHIRAASPHDPVMGQRRQLVLHHHQMCAARKESVVSR